MPNGGTTPDCIHCKHYLDPPSHEGEPRCTYHNIQLASMIRIFCSKYVDPNPNEFGDWLDQLLTSREQLNDDTMYIWLGGYEIKFFHVPLAPISEFANWTREKFYDEFDKLVEKYRKELGHD